MEKETKGGKKAAKTAEEAANKEQQTEEAANKEQQTEEAANKEQQTEEAANKEQQTEGLRLEARGRVEYGGKIYFTGQLIDCTDPDGLEAEIKMGLVKAYGC